MQALIWIGTALTVLGILGLGYCVLTVQRARRAGLDEGALRNELRRAVTINMGAVAVSALGLMLVVAGVMLD